jgi:hypothetical protein
MRRDYDIFEKFADGSTLWRCWIRGQHEAKRKIQELAEHSENEFVLIDIQAETFLPVTVKAVRTNSQPLAKSANG